MPSLFDPNLIKAYAADKQALENTQIPIVTVFGTYREDVKGWHGLPEDESLSDIVLSRAHYSMAFGTAVQAWGGRINKTKAWLVDPTNYVSSRQWSQVSFTETVGKTIARFPMLKTAKDLIDRFGRTKLPILDSITPPLLFLTEKIHKPFLSFHIATGNILLDHGKKVLQVITDPHVRYDYLKHAGNPNLNYCVFDQGTKDELLEKAKLAGLEINPNSIYVTGPPVDPRIVACRDKKQPWRSGPLKLCLATGGLGTNKYELLQIIENLAPTLRQHGVEYQLLVYAGTHADIYHAVENLAKMQHIKLGKLDDQKAELRIIYHPQIVDANELLIKYGFKWADGFITKPSGDMAYDAVAAGCFLLTLKEWGEWEGIIRQRFEELGISRRAVAEQLPAQLISLTSAQHNTPSFVTRAMSQAQRLPSLYLHGAENILKAYERTAKSKS